MTSALGKLLVGDDVEIKGPLGPFIWQGRGTALVRGVPTTYEEIGMVCAGSGTSHPRTANQPDLPLRAGITPIIQVLRAILHDDDATRVWLVCCNRTAADILLRDELDALHGRERVAIHHVLSAAASGRVSDAILREHLPAPSAAALVLACGPDAMVREVIRPGLERCGWDVERQLVVF